MLKHKIEEPLQEVRRWKEKVSRETRGMSPEEAVKYFREGAEAVWKEHGYKCILVRKGAYKYISP